MLLAISYYLWNAINWKFLEWYSSPLQVLTPLGVIFAFTLVMRSGFWRRWIRRSTLGMAIAYLALISPVGASGLLQGLNLFLPDDNQQSADAVVILGRGYLLQQERTQRAAQIWRNQRAPIILATGNTDAPQFIDQLLQDGIPPTALLEEPWASTTEENAALSVPLLKAKNVKRIILVTDSPHMLRSLLTFRSFGLDVIPAPIPLPSNMTSIVASRTTIREYLGLLVYGLTGRFSHRPNNG